MMFHFILGYVVAPVYGFRKVYNPKHKQTKLYLIIIEKIDISTVVCFIVMGALSTSV